MRHSIRKDDEDRVELTERCEITSGGIARKSIMRRADQRSENPKLQNRWMKMSEERRRRERMTSKGKKTMMMNKRRKRKRKRLRQRQRRIEETLLNQKASRAWETKKEIE